MQPGSPGELILARVQGLPQSSGNSCIFNCQMARVQGLPRSSGNSCIFNCQICILLLFLVLFNIYIRRMGKVMFSQTCVCPRGQGFTPVRPIAGAGRWGVPQSGLQSWGGIPQIGRLQEYPPLPKTGHAMDRICFKQYASCSHVGCSSNFSAYICVGTLQNI